MRAPQSSTAPLMTFPIRPQDPPRTSQATSAKRKSTNPEVIQAPQERPDEPRTPEVPPKDPHKDLRRYKHLQFLEESAVADLRATHLHICIYNIYRCIIYIYVYMCIYTYTCTYHFNCSAGPTAQRRATPQQRVISATVYLYTVIFSTIHSRLSRAKTRHHSNCMVTSTSVIALGGITRPL